MARTLQERVVAEGVTVADSAVLEDQLSESAWEVVGILPESVLWAVAEEKSDSGAGVALTGRVLRAYSADGYKAEEINPIQAARYITGDLQTSGKCVYYVSAGKLYILPEGGRVLMVDFPTPAATDTAVSGWPAAFPRVLALHAAAKIKESELRALREGLPTLFGEGTLPTIPDAPAFTYTDAVAAEVSDVTIGSFGSIPSYSSQSLSLSSVPTIADVDLTGITAPSSPSFPSAPSLPSTPVAPDAATISYTDATATSPVATTISTIATAPTITMPSVPTFSYVDFETYRGDEDTEMMEGLLRRIDREVAQYGSQVDAAVNNFKSSLETWLKGAARQEEQAKITAAQAAQTAQNATDVAVQNKARSLEAQATNAATAINRYRSQVEAYGTTVEAQVGLYRAQVESLVQAYVADAQVYRTAVDAAVQVAKINADKDIALSDLERKGELEGMSLRIRNESERVGAAVAVYQVAANKEMEQARIILERLSRNAASTTDVSKQNRLQQLVKQVQEYESKLARFQQQLASYGSEAQRLAVRVESGINLFATKVRTLRAELGDLNRRFQDALAAYISNNRRTISYDIQGYDI